MTEVFVPSISWREYLDKLRVIMDGVDGEEVSAVAKQILETAVSKGKILVAGNGGSAATANHFATDLVCGLGRLGAVLPVISLASNAASISATVNDEGSEEVFSRQIRAIAAPGDLLIVFSASGRSPNVLRAISVARSLGVKSIAVLGFDGGLVREVADFVVMVESVGGEYGPVEDCHLAICHAIKEIIWASMVSK